MFVRMQASIEPEAAERLATADPNADPPRPC
jgi:hypothetical protein